MACDLIARHWLPLFNLGRAETVARWIDALPRQSAVADSRVCLARAWAALQPGVVEEMESWLRAAEHAARPESSPGIDVITSVEGGAGLLRQTSALMLGDVAGLWLSVAVPSRSIRKRLTRAGRSRTSTWA